MSKKAPEFLDNAAKHMKDRAATYDAPQGERSMGKTVAAFNALTGLDMKEKDGWMFMALLKMTRANQGLFRLDNHEDLVAYSALYGEAAHTEYLDSFVMRKGDSEVVAKSNSDTEINVEVNSLSATPDPRTPGYMPSPGSAWGKR